MHVCTCMCISLPSTHPSPSYMHVPQCFDDVQGIPTTSYNFVSIASIESIEPNSLIGRANTQPATLDVLHVHVEIDVQDCTHECLYGVSKSESHTGVVLISAIHFMLLFT